MRIAILGTRGIPNNYGGFEQFAEYLSVGLVNLGHSVTVYNPDFHDYKADMFNGVQIKRIYCPENKLGASAHFIYDYLCLKDALKQGFDIIYEAGYGTASFSYFQKKKGKPYIVTNMDGLEWKRSKWNRFTKKVMRYAEKVAVNKSDFLISDNIGIQTYYQEEYNAASLFLPYGADQVTEYAVHYLESYGVQQSQYYLLIARLEPENSIDLMLEAYSKSNEQCPLLVIGNYKTKYGQYLEEKYKGGKVRFLGGVYDKKALDSLRCFAKAYLHGHTVGGTNPSLLEAMASNAFIISHDNQFNRSVLQGNALFFDSVQTLKSIFDNIEEIGLTKKRDFVEANQKLIEEEYTWERIVKLHHDVFEKMLMDGKQ